MLSKVVRSTIALDEVSATQWDIVVIGAGLAGALAARQAAAEGCKVLLVDRAEFPRWKVCGCCLNGAAIDVLARSGLSKLIDDCEAIPLSGLQISSGRRSAVFDHNHGVVVSRERLDSALIRAAIDAGAEFLGSVNAQAEPIDQRQITVQLKDKRTQSSVNAPIVIAAAGLGGRVFSDRSNEHREVSKASRVGTGAVIEECPPEIETGVIYMNCHASGYVGLVRLEDGRLDIAAALDVQAMKRRGGPANLVAEILQRSSLPAPSGIQSASWHGTPMLTQRRTNVAENGCLFVGDAAGYVEPFTGEGMAWALACGNAAATLAVRAVESGSMETLATQWRQHHREMIVRRSRICKMISIGLRYPMIPQVSVPLLSLFPWVAGPFIRSMNAPFRLDALPESA
ncbi:MAG: FAD-dependent oxidoreductase [Aureliella sp.]